MDASMLNAENNVLGVRAFPEVRLSANWEEFIGGLSAAATDFFLKGAPDAASGGVSSLVKFLASVRMEPNPAQRAWVLTVLSFAWAANKVKASCNISQQDMMKILKDGISAAKNNIEEISILISSDFLERPTSIPLYGILKGFFINSLGISDSGLLSEIGFRIDAAFNRAIYEIWSKKPEFYAPIAESINNPGENAARNALGWMNYRSKLVYDFEVDPLFGQEETKISLSQLYVPLRCLWKKDDVRLHKESVNSDRLEVQDIAMLDDTLDRWLDNGDANDWLRLVGGGPGSGKSTTLKSLARRVAKLEQWRPLFIPLQHVGLERDLRDSINSYFVDAVDSAFTQPPLSRISVEDGAPLLLIFDGLDELVAPGEAAKEVVGTFANRLNSLVTALGGDGKRLLKVVVSGRMPSFQAAGRYLTPPLHASLEVYGFLPVEDAPRGDGNELWRLDQRPVWWSQYATLAGEQIETPEAFSNERLAGITHEPLLCYLLALAGYATEHWELAAENRNRIYSALIDSIYLRGWGDGAVKRHGPGRHMSKANFNKLMETIALAAWLGGDTKVATEENFTEAVAIAEAEDAWKAFTDDNGDDVTNLALNFYLKSADKSQRGFEFTHKSFGEYLASRAILSVAEEVFSQASRKPEYALMDWIKATGSGTITREMLLFIRDEVRLSLTESNRQDKFDDLKVRKLEFQALAKRAAADGFPLSNGASNFRRLILEQANAESCLWVIISAYSTALYKAGREDIASIRMDWESKGQLNSLLHRLTRFGGSAIVLLCMRNVIADRQELRNLNVANADFAGASLMGCLFIGVSMAGASFCNANLKKSRFYHCFVRESNFAEASMEGFSIHVSQFGGCSYANISGNVVISPGSLMLMDKIDLDILAGNMQLMISGTEYRDVIIDAVAEKAEILQSMPTVVVRGLIQDVSRDAVYTETEEDELADQEEEDDFDDIGDDADDFALREL